MTKKTRIKDIAEQSGVSVGTVDRVLHDRPNVSKEAREKVERVLKEIGYQPNMYASALAYNKSHLFVCIIPEHKSETYWEEIETGAQKARDLRRDFRIEIKILYYKRYDSNSFINTTKECLSLGPSGVVVVPSEYDETKQFTDILHKRNIPFILLDSNLPDLKPLSFLGQDSFCSGNFAARMLMLLAKDDKEIMIMKHTKDGKVPSRQQYNREVGFRHYMEEHFPDTVVYEVDLPIGCEKCNYDDILDSFFSSHPDVRHCITFCSKAHLVGDYLLRKGMTTRQIMGYDMVEKNAECLRKGSISFLIAQHAYMQGYNSIEALFRAVVLRKAVDSANFMPIELICKENINFYRREQL